MEIKVDIQAALESALASAFEQTKIENLLKEQLSLLVDLQIKEQLSRYGEFSKVVAKSINELFPHKIDLEGMAVWNHAIKKAIQDRVNAVNDERIAQAILPMLEEVLASPPKEMKLSDLVNRAVEFWKSDDALFDTTSDRPSIIIRRSNSVDGYWMLGLDKDYGKDIHNCEIFMQVSSDGKIFGLRIDRKEIGTRNKTVWAGPFYSFERDIFMLYACGTKLILDEENFDDVYYRED